MGSIVKEFKLLLMLIKRINDYYINEYVIVIVIAMINQNISFIRHFHQNLHYSFYIHLSSSLNH
jgi:hypothetical protein